MSFLGDIFSTVGDSVGGMLGSATKGLDDAAHLDFNGLGDDGQSFWDASAEMPLSPTAQLSGFYDAMQGDKSWNPFDEGNSAWDTGLLGTRLSEDPRMRALGRAAGTLVGTVATGGALAPYLGTVGGGAAAGALWGGGQAALTGGSVGESALTGGLAGGAGAGIGNAVRGLTAGSEYIPSYFQNSVSGGLAGGALSALQGKGFQSGLESGAAKGAFGDIIDSFNLGNTGGKSVDTWGNNFQPGADTNYSNEGRNYTVPESTMSSPINSQAPQLSFMDRLGQVYNDFAGKPGGTPQLANNSTQQQGNPYVNAASSLASLYGAYKGMKGNGSYLNSLQSMYGQNSPYAQQLQQELARRDAASGRRSQYGPRSVELQAALAKANAGMAPAIMQGQQNDFNNKIRLAQMFGNSLSPNGAFSPSRVAGMYTGIQGLFGGGQPAPQTGYGGFMGGQQFDTSGYGDALNNFGSSWGGNG